MNLRRRKEDRENVKSPEQEELFTEANIPPISPGIGYNALPIADQLRSSLPYDTHCICPYIF